MIETFIVWGFYVLIASYAVGLVGVAVYIVVGLVVEWGKPHAGGSRLRPWGG